MLRDITDLPDLEIVGKIEVQSQQTNLANLNATVRFDLLCSANGRFINVEVQTSHETNLIKRARMYSSVLDTQLQNLKRSAGTSNRYNIDDTYVIFLCSRSAFPGKRGDIILQSTTVYRNVLKEERISGDGRVCIFVDYDDPMLGDLQMEYLTAVCNAMSKVEKYRMTYTVDKYEKLLQKAMARNNFSDEEVSNMLTQEERERIARESREEGLEEGIGIGIEKIDSLIFRISECRGHDMSPEEISAHLGVDVRQVLRYYNLFK